MTTTNFFKLNHFAKQAVDLLFTNANCSYDDFLLHGNSELLEHAIKRIFYKHFEYTIYKLEFDVSGQRIAIVVYNSESELSVFRTYFVFGV